MMGSSFLLLLLVTSLAFPSASLAQGGSCSQTFQGKQLQFAQCTNLNAAGTFTLAWSKPVSTPTGIAVQVFFSGTPEAGYGWAGWGISPSGQMLRSDAIVGYGDPNNPTSATVRRYKLSGYSPNAVTPDQSYGLLTPEPGTMAIEVASSGSLIKTIANVTLPSGQPLIVIWRSGPGLLDASTGQLIPHNYLAAESRTIDFSTSAASTNDSTPVVSAMDTTVRNQQQKIAHAFLAGIGFGVLLPLGVLVARHLKLWADPTWFYLHMALQITGYLTGVAGWGVGVWLKQQFGDMSLAPSIQFDHYAIGMTIFCTATLQILTPVLKPDKASSTRLFWNLVHWGLGYSTLILTFVQVFFGFAILRNESISSSGWQTGYIVFLAIWLALLLLLEPVSWFKYRQTKVEEERRFVQADSEQVKPSTEV